ncbi:ribonuclease HII [Bacillus ectoiniformans]|uniref:ribonuclease HII n=1 Tax=Bacillus ectoiniformans TaxID=1494429 RepID=UPI00195A649D|nr:ribonuclease HII [Bacillus ectoiniformans]
MTHSISEIKDRMKDIESEHDPLFMQWKEDHRKGVQQLIKSWYRAKEKQEQERELYQTMSLTENELKSKGISLIAGIDEVGRGPLAGPVIAAAVILPLDFYLPGLTDSKKVSEAKRNLFYEMITGQADVGIGIIEPDEIDRINIYEATKQAMIQAIGNLKQAPEHLLIDAMKLDLPTPQTSIIKGDAKSVSIAAASIIAKVTRDRLMADYAEVYPEYRFEKNMGYGTKDHLEGLDQYGPCTIHRKSFAPVKDMC